MSGKRTRLDKSKYIARTHAKASYCLTDQDLEGTACIEKPNPRSKNGPPMHLYEISEVETVALAKWGGASGLLEEQQKRATKREALAVKRAGNLAGKTIPEVHGKGSSPAVAELRTLLAERVRVVQPGKLPTSRSSGPPPTISAAGASREPSTGAAASTSSAQPACEVPQGPIDLASTSGQGGKAGSTGRAARCVLYWMRTGVRGHENPALEAAQAEAAARGLPLVVAYFVLASHPFSNARRISFLLEGLRDAQQELRTQGIELLVHADGMASSDGDTSESWDQLLHLAAGADVVVTEDMPVRPHDQWLADLQAVLPGTTALWAVDTACIMAMSQVGKLHVRAYTYRSQTEAPRKVRIMQMYSPTAASSAITGIPSRSESVAQLPVAQWGLPACCRALAWAPLDLSSTAIPALVASLPWVDQSVPAVKHMPGGSRAGYDRWHNFKLVGLNKYSSKRNAFLQRNGVSRLSAYHHWGMISPWRIAREAMMSGGAGGSAKFLDEFLTWRELSYSWCHEVKGDMHSHAVLPQWAQDTLAAHAGDERDVKTLEQLEKGATGDQGWDAMQHQLVLTGELHNNLRMTWGKAVLQWTSAAESIRTLVHLNHKYALDGCDPCSYSGILWCHGLFDGPKGSDKVAIFGKVSKRSTASVVNKMGNVDAYRALAV